MYVLLSIILLVIAIVCHEFGHALAMRRYGVEVESMGIGLNIWPTITLKSRWTAKLFGQSFRIILSPWIITAYVKPKHEDYEKNLTYIEKSHVYGAGIIANIALALVLFSILGAISFIEKNWDGPSFWFAAACLFALHCLLRYARVFAAYVLPIVSLFTTWLLVMIFWGKSWGHFMDSSGGPVSIGLLAYEMAGNIKLALVFGAATSFGLALTNTLPFYPLDGGRTWSEILKRYASRLVVPVQLAGIFLTLTLLALALLGDVYRILP